MRERRDLHPALSPDQRRALFHHGIELFNRGAFYEAHEAWEDIWRSTTPEPKTLFQGLIQAAAAFHQLLSLDRRTGPRNTLAKAARNLDLHTPAACGLDIAAVRLSIERWRAWLEGEAEDRPPLPVVRVLDWAQVE